MRPEQDRRTRMGRDLEGQYEKDPWRPDWRSEPPPRYLGTGFPGRGGPGFTGGYYGFGAGSLEPDRRARPRYPPGPKGYQRSDERLREDISERLMVARYIDSSDVTVEVSGAKVTLDGTVPERPMKHAIEDLVDACPGVQDIENKICVKR